MTPDYIAFRAAERPDAVAVIDAGRQVTYLELARAVRSLARNLSELGLAPGSKVAIGCNDSYSHLLLLLAFERLGIATASFQPQAPTAAPRIFERLDLVVADPRFQTAGARRVLAIDGEWMRRATTGAENAGSEPPFLAPDLAARLIPTSGTTTAPKWLQISRRMHDALVREWIWGFGLSAGSRLLLTLSFSVRALYVFASAVLRVGGAVVCNDRANWAALLSPARVSHVIVLPIVLARVLETLPRDFVKPPALTVLCFGAHLPPTLREAALARLATEVCDLYGSIETGSVSASWRADDGGFGTIWPRVQVEALDERGRPVPPGEPGRLRVRTEHMVEGYLDDPETTTRMFRDGWFHSGDVGILDGRGRLRVLGRADDLLNIGGVKVMPPALEELLLARVPIGDVAVASLPSPSGIDALWVAVSAPRCPRAELAPRIAQALFPYGFNPIEVRILDAIPRNPNGKIERGRLREMLRAMGRRK